MFTLHMTLHYIYMSRFLVETNKHSSLIKLNKLHELIQYNFAPLY